ncbi:hypothetical protein PAESOLCIP111_02416 [Paenibacillus solanacearum]|uniref:Sialidase domain-containing protein n=2 Tax=Paenibacillus solanacearum TaxID=2048548 RepID=A0A916NJ45_9BACL|nr:hypothetical protein PAESOLCIP111_02416 [Paenibacillus solanacearum]
MFTIRRLPAFLAFMLAGSLLVSCETDRLPGTELKDKGDHIVSEMKRTADPNSTSIKISMIEHLNTGAGELNSHESETAGSRLELNIRQYVELNAAQLGTNKAMYPRLKKLADGSYILFYQDGKIGWNIYYVKSNDLVEWTKPRPLFTSYKILNGTDSRCFSTVDAIVLQNGDLLAIASYRANKGYTTLPEHNGLMMRRSGDGGATWEDEKIIYVGPNWEPSMLQLPSGEIQVYFTHVAPKMAVENTLHSSGTAIIRSYDNGATWTPHVTESPYAAHRIAQQYVKTTEKGVKSFTDQMPSAIWLNGGKGIALAMESQLADSKYKISVAYSSDNWAKGLETDEPGPADRSSNMYPGAAPYLAQFPSGETVLAYNEGSSYRLRIGDTGARSFGSDYIPFSGKGYWGATERIGSHALVATMPKVVSVGNSDYKNSIMIGRLYLNHRIDAKKGSITMGGGMDEWNQHTDALFLGSDSQAQATIRSAHDGKNLYLLVERLDRYLMDEDTISIYIGSGDDKQTFYKLDVNVSGVTQISQYANGAYQTLPLGEVKSVAAVNGTVGQEGNNTSGYLVKTALPLSSIAVGGAKMLRFNAILYNKDAGTPKTSDTFTGASLTDQDTWLTIRLE